MPPTLLKRLLSLPKDHSFFLFGARNTGKSTLLAAEYSTQESILIDLLDSKTEERFSRDPDELYQIVLALPEHIKYVIIDEIQKAPALLDTVHRLMKDTNKYFILTGSSARKLKHGGANLLAGRAFVFHLFPLTSVELADDFDLDRALQWGTLPQLLSYQSDMERQEFLHAYAHTYLKEEIWGEHIIRKLDPFRRFLEVAAQNNGKIINFNNIAKDVGIDDKTIRSYYQILEDTLIGFFLDSFHHSFRKRLAQKPKFYFFDTGITRALAHLATVPLAPQTSVYGEAFEHFIILECMRLANYYRLNYRFSYLRTMADAEIDLIIERPGKPLLLIEIKSSKQVKPEDISTFIRLSKDIEKSEAICLCQDQYAKKIAHVLVLPWQQALAQFFNA